MGASDDTISDTVSEYLTLLRRPLAPPDVAVSFVSDAMPVRDARPCALLLTPHPDDECLTGALPLRLQQEQGWQIINIAVTLGSNLKRRTGRAAELAKACAVLGFDCFTPVADGFSDINEASRAADAAAWQQKTKRLADIIAHYKPQALFMPHLQDWNATHLGVHHLGMEALALQPAAFSCAVVLTEYWQPLAEPNLMIGVRQGDVTKLLSALTCHVKEVARNPYDRRFPAFLIDNVRRGGERLNGKGTVAADMDFAMMYKYGIWRGGKFIPSALNRIVGVDDALDIVFS